MRAEITNGTLKLSTIPMRAYGICNSQKKKNITPRLLGDQMSTPTTSKRIFLSHQVPILARRESWVQNIHSSLYMMA